MTSYYSECKQNLHYYIPIVHKVKFKCEIHVN